MGDKGRIWACVGAIVLVLLVIFVILMAVSFSGLDYYEYGFKVQRSTGVVDRSRVYGPGRYALGPDFTFKRFMADAHYLKYDDVTVFTSDKLQVTISVSVQYFLRKQQLKELLNKFDVDYEKTMKTNAQSAIKNAAIQFTARDYINRRADVQAALFTAVRRRLGGSCCEEGCVQAADGEAPASGLCVAGCAEAASCNVTSQGLYAEVRYFQLGRLQVPASLQAKYLRALILDEENSREKLVQQAQLIREDTRVKVKAIDNDATEELQRSVAEASRVVSFAAASATAKVDEARSLGQQYLYEKLNFTRAAHRASFDYLRTMKGLNHLQLAVGFDSLRINGGT